ncbi:MAG: IS91 family transposase [Desulfobacteraceae bacterium]|nr:IS91 family transposase [Desulfobacteraceae bacterium]
MTQIIKPQKAKLEVADILQKYIRDYQNAYPLWPDQHRILSHILNCRTARLGGHIERCNHCGAERIMYHSCRNRHCPKCQQIPRERWLEKRKSELLPVTYFHVIFTLPHELNAIILSNKSHMFNTLFKAVSKTLLQFGETNIGGKLGFVAVLHTWDQQLKAHFHLHCLVAGGAVCSKNKRWIPCKDDYLFNQEALSLVFRGKFIDYLTRAIRSGKLKVDLQYQQFKNKLYKHKWVVSVRKPITQPQHVLEYLARYTHRVAIANSRLTALKDGRVSFRYKDRKNNRLKQTTISAVKFIRRFLLHTLPQGFVRIRHYGFLANRDRTANLTFIRRLLKLPFKLLKINSSLQEMMLKLTGIDITLCPCCKKGKMLLVAEIPRHSGKHPYDFIRPPNYLAPVTG